MATEAKEVKTKFVKLSIHYFRSFRGRLCPCLVTLCQIRSGNRASSILQEMAPRVITPMINLHPKHLPVLSVEVHPCGRLVTAGADNAIRVWDVS